MKQMLFITPINRWSLILAFLLMVNLLGLPDQAQAEDSRYFSETGYTVSGKFLQYWNDNGGLATYGFPITNAQNEIDPETGRTFLTQWFERNRFELHPENTGTKYEVLLGLLGKDLNRSWLSAGPFGRSRNIGAGNYYNETGHNLNGRFQEYWSANGGLERFGFPISEEFQDVDPETGKTFVMQWFERARFEKHPENARPYDVLLGLLGKQIIVSKQTENLPAPPNATRLYFNRNDIITFQQITNNIADISKVSYSLYSTKDDFIPVSDFYKTELAKNGWVLDPTNSNSFQTFFTRGDQTAAVQFFPIKSQVEVSTLVSFLPSLGGQLKVGENLVLLSKGPTMSFPKML